MAEALHASKIKRIHIEKCGISNTAILLHFIKQIEQTKDFKSIIVRSEELAITEGLFNNILLRQEPFHLGELKIEFCKLDSISIGHLTKSLSDMSGAYLSSPAIKTLSLVDANLAGSRESVGNMISYIKRN